LAWQTKRTDKDGGIAHRSDFTGQARQVFDAVKALVGAVGARAPTWSRSTRT